MELQRQGANVAVILFNDGTRVLFSYDTPVAAYIPGRGFVKSSRYFSRTTSAHVSKFHGATGAATVDHDEIAQLAREVR